MKSLENLKEAIADHGIEIALECCADLIQDGYLDETHASYDRQYLIRFLENNRKKVEIFQIQDLDEET